ncbi:non-canonical purine NTP pyrophosphatase [Campylobacter corcagiensis]|uniref:dITP/XTP pyrophosphatase n=1 Tax=Campylobacter corcagiensis TaxID=1448857 RepID=A0A7M1LI10_9BACT|nr:non-canonical purine NTP pyrophosphatase [Campylobacter corcagiensis]QKF65340.1 putative dITP/XTP pyrophosphatase [Campylobacter corcagiensis]QOQ88080.1 non-canonical purine NTP pyrophosphatase [Campylobacter corcagiensis]
MKIVLATSNGDKVKEIKEFYKEFEIYALSEVLEPFYIDETGKSFKQNALIKSRAVYEKICQKGLENEFISLSDDSGISLPILNGEPGIYSARYSLDLVTKPTDKTNRQKLISKIKALNLKSSPAFYTACIAVSSKFGDFTTHGFMYGDAITQERGKNGFGYDFMFIPKGFDKTISELDIETKLKLSHRSKALELMRYILKTIV